MALTLDWLPDDDNELADFRQAQVWQMPADAPGRSIGASPATLARFTVNNAQNPLPVTLVAFTAEARGAALARRLGAEQRPV